MLKIMIGVARLNFLTLTLVCIVLAAAAAWQLTSELSVFHFFMVLIAGLAAHISVNALNEYFDFRSGLDFLTHKTPFSGGTGTLIAHSQGSHYALILGVVTLVIVSIIGLWLSYQYSWQLLLLGLPGVAMIYAYTEYINRKPLLCLLAPGVGFGLMMTLGAFWVFAGYLTPGSWILAGIITLLVSNLLLLNQFPDVEADAQVGRRHLPIVIGRYRSAWLFTFMLISSYLLLILGVWQQWLPYHCLLGLLSIVLMPPLLRGVFNNVDTPIALSPYLGLNVAIIHLYPLLITIALIWAGFSSST